MHSRTMGCPGLRSGQGTTPQSQLGIPSHIGVKNIADEPTRNDCVVEFDCPSIRNSSVKLTTRLVQEVQSFEALHIRVNVYTPVNAKRTKFITKQDVQGENLLTFGQTLTPVAPGSHTEQCQTFPHSWEQRQKQLYCGAQKMQLNPRPTSSTPMLGASSSTASCMQSSLEGRRGRAISGEFCVEWNHVLCATKSTTEALDG